MVIVSINKSNLKVITCQSYNENNEETVKQTIVKNTITIGYIENEFEIKVMEDEEYEVYRKIY